MKTQQANIANQIANNFCRLTSSSFFGQTRTALDQWQGQKHWHHLRLHRQLLTKEKNNIQETNSFESPKV